MKMEVSVTEALESIKSALEGKNLTPSTSEVTMLPQSTVNIVGQNAVTLLKLMEFLDDHEDVQQVYSNFDIDEEIMSSTE